MQTARDQLAPAIAPPGVDNPDSGYEPARSDHRMVGRASGDKPTHSRLKVIE
jgi:hypothetical protein